MHSPFPKPQHRQASRQHDRDSSHTSSSEVGVRLLEEGMDVGRLKELEASRWWDSSKAMVRVCLR